MTEESETPVAEPRRGRKYGRRLLAAILAALGTAAAFTLIATLGNLYVLNPGAQYSYLELILPTTGESLIAAIFGAIMGIASDWFWGSTTTASAVTAGIGAAGVGAMITFGFLAATLVPWLQVLWIIAIGASVTWATIRSDQ